MCIYIYTLYIYTLLCSYQKTEVYPSVSTFPSNPIVIEGNEEVCELNS